MGTGPPKYDGRNAGYTPRGNTVGQQEHIPTDAIEHHRDAYKDIIAQLFKQCSFIKPLHQRLLRFMEAKLSEEKEMAK